MTKLSLSRIISLTLGCAALVPGGTSANAREFHGHGGTTFVMTPVPSSSPQQYAHTVDGVVWISLLGDCTFHAVVMATVPTPPSVVWPLTDGIFTITTPDGTSTLTATAEGYATSNPENPAILDLYYKVTFTGGTGKLAHAHGTAELIDGFASLATSPGFEDFPGFTGLVYPPNADLIDPNSEPGQSGDLTGKACWLIVGNLQLLSGDRDH
ncbi:MAG TPA: hypothetical protein VG146_01965 [Verrucomicrobiae bacterium]|nr:hypothetical protein [Verrucomicrobiae bacterium]